MPLTRGGNVRGGNGLRVGTRNRVAKQLEDFVDASFSESEAPILHPIPKRPPSLSRGSRGNRGVGRGSRGARGGANSKVAKSSATVCSIVRTNVTSNENYCNMGDGKNFFLLFR